jgi:ADP-ribose pyrophosphatase YjhB (NUDIX family)
MIHGGTLRMLACFREDDSHTFMDLCRQADYPIDLGGYYLRQLVSTGYLVRAERGRYTITPKGKHELASNSAKNRRNYRSGLIALLVITQGTDYALLKRTIQPFPNRIEWPTGSVGAGESMSQAIQRILLMQAGIQTTEPVTFKGIFRRIDMYGPQVFDDKSFAVYTCRLPDHTIQPAAAASGEIFLCSQSQIEALPRRSRALLDILAFTQQSEAFAEHTYHLKDADLRA